MGNINIDNGDLDCLSTKLINQQHVEDFANAETVTITFDKMTEAEAYYLIRMLRQDNSGYRVKRPRSIILGLESTTEKLEKVFAKRT